MKKLFLGLLCSVVILGLATGCGISSDDSKKYNININADEKIDVKTYVDYDKNYLIVYLTNNNDYNIGSLDAEAKYYDKNGNSISVESNVILGFVSGGNYVFTMDLPHDDEYNNYIPDKIDLSIKVDKEYQEIVDADALYNDKVTTKYTKSSDNVQVNIKNNSGVKLYTVEVAVLFMKNGKPIYVDNLIDSLDVGESKTESIEIPTNWEASKNLDKDILIELDSIELVVNRASVE